MKESSAKIMLTPILFSAMITSIKMLRGYFMKTLLFATAAYFFFYFFGFRSTNEKVIFAAEKIK
ncbi:MAG: hypothetical protein GX567_05690 [Clostridia bacterium]|nr:hypothetical protein [Clostridia bacterium]